MVVKVVEILTKDGAMVGKDSVFRVESASEGRKVERCSVMRKKTFKSLFMSKWKGLGEQGEV